jgi:hypothetical protein
MEDKERLGKRDFFSVGTTKAAQLSSSKRWYANILQPSRSTRGLSRS